MIPKTLHFIWIGDEAKRPDNCIQTWARLNPDYQIKIWGNDTLGQHTWLNARHMDAMLEREFNGVADMMRWEILYREGGIVVDADSICIRALDDALLDCEAFACWESEIARPGLIAAGYFGCRAKNPFVHQIMQDIHREPSVVHDRAWKTVGPQRLTESYRRYQYHPLRILPSHYFIPEHFTGVKYSGPGPVYANQMWGSTKNAYQSLHLQQFDADGNIVAQAGADEAAAPVSARQA
ncbi:glycosyltransferase family 32 protein, partial [Ralstonia pseudosolanacearum]